MSHPYKDQAFTGQSRAKQRYAEGGVVTDTRDQNELDPDKYMRDKETNSDPRNIYDDQGNLVDYDDKDHSKKEPK